MVTKPVFMNTARGVVSERKAMPVLIPVSIRRTYLDDTPHAIMNEGHVVGPGVINERTQRIEDLRMAAAKGSTDPNRDDGGWLSGAMKGLDGDASGNVTLLEYEGDLIVSRKTTTSLFLPGVIVTVASGRQAAKGSATIERVVRFRWRQIPYTSYLAHPYHLEDLASPYGTGPLTKGMHVHRSAVHALGVLQQVAELNAQPPIKYDRQDPYFVQNGGPRVEPGASWGTVGDIDAVEIGDPAAMLQVYISFLRQYEDLTGVNAPRLGAQTVSHTTAFAKEAEISRGTVRTVDYVRSVLQGPLTRWLYMEYAMDRRSFRGTESIYLDSYRGFVEITRDALPKNVAFDVFGAGGPLEEQQKKQERFSSMQQAIQIDALKVQQGLPPTLDYEAIQRQILTEGGWPDVDPLIRSEGPAQGAAGGPAVAGGAGGGGGAGIAALQNLAGAA
jgi:hypothetical protein